MREKLSILENKTRKNLSGFRGINTGFKRLTIVPITIR
jgi:hypothetical protein